MFHIIQITSDDVKLRLWAKPFYDKFHKDFEKESDRTEPRLATVFDLSTDINSDMSEVLERGCLLYFAMLDDTPIGYILFNNKSDHASNGMYLAELFIDAKHRSNGYAFKLITSTLYHIKKQYPNVKYMILNVLEKNKNAAKLYEKLKFITMCNTLVCNV